MGLLDKLFGRRETAKIKEPAVEPLIQKLEDERLEIQSWAAEALGKIGDVRAVELLIKALKDEDSRVRTNVELALMEIRDKRAAKPLIQALKENEDK